MQIWRAPWRRDQGQPATALQRPCIVGYGKLSALYISQLWEPSSDSEGSVEIEVQVAPEAEILLSQSATPVWLGPRPKLLQATPKAHPKFL